MTKTNYKILRLLKNNESGAAFVEFALLAGVFIVLSFAIIDFGRAMWLKNTIEHIAAEGARYAAVRGTGKASPTTESEIITYIENRADGIPAADMDITVTWPGVGVNPPAGSAVTVLVTYTYEYIIGEMVGLDPIDLEGRSSMIVN